MYRIIGTIVSITSIFIAPAHAEGDPAKAQAIVNQVCIACHGVDGNSPLPANPSLAGQHPEYLLKQLMEFKSGARVNAVMAGMVASLSAQDMRNLAAYYSSQIPKQIGARDKELVAEGSKLYRGGNSATNMAACAGCHSPNGSGIPAQYPRLAGQQPEYVATQLKAFRSGDRANDPNQMMRATAGKLSDKQIDALADYISGLH
jgi:cytochrome c553